MDDDDNELMMMMTCHLRAAFWLADTYESLANGSPFILLAPQIVHPARHCLQFVTKLVVSGEKLD